METVNQSVINQSSITSVWFFFFVQGSAKLEKAEILQMTVDHLKMLQVAGGKGNGSGATPESKGRGLEEGRCPQQASLWV